MSAAGITHARQPDAMREALGDLDRPPTPPHVHNFRDMRIEPGKVVRHPGSAADSLPHNIMHGRRTPKDALTAADVLQSAPVTRLEAWRQQQAETIYSSTQQRPLGRAPLPRSRGSASPASSAGGTQSPANQCLSDGAVEAGAEAQGCDPHLQPLTLAQRRRARQLADGRGVREALAPIVQGAEDSAVHQQYITSHHGYLPGEQRSRHYDWHGLDPGSHAFGAAPDSTPRDGSAARALLGGGTHAEGIKDPSSRQDCSRRSSRFSSSAGSPAGSGGPSYGWAAVGSGYISGAAGGLTSPTVAAPPTGHNQQAASRSLDDEAPLGRPRYLHCANRQLPADHVFGVPSHGREPQESAGGLIHPQASEAPADGRMQQQHPMPAASSANYSQVNPKRYIIKHCHMFVTILVAEAGDTHSSLSESCPADCLRDAAAPSRSHHHW